MHEDSRKVNEGINQTREDENPSGNDVPRLFLPFFRFWSAYECNDAGDKQHQMNDAVT